MREQAEELVRRMRAGIEREESARRLDLLLRPRLVRYFAAHAFRQAEAEDLVQQTLIRVFQGIDGLREEASFVGWLFVIARNVGFTARRDRARERALESATFDTDGEPRNPERGAVLPDAEERLWLDEVGRSLAELPAQQRRCLVLAVRDGLSYAEIGDLLGLSPRTVRNHLAEGRRRLRAALGRGGEAR